MWSVSKPKTQPPRGTDRAGALVRHDWLLLDTKEELEAVQTSDQRGLTGLSSQPISVCPVSVQKCKPSLGLWFTVQP